MTFPWTRSTAAVLLIVTSATGCGNTDKPAAVQSSTPPSATSTPAPTPAPTPTPTPAPDLGKLTAAALFAKAKAAVTAANTFRVRGTITDGTTIALDAQVARTTGSGKFTVDGEEISVLTAGKNTYLSFSEKSLRKRGKEAKDSPAEIDAMVKLFKGKWIKPSKKSEEFQFLADLTSRGRYLGLFVPSGALTKKPQQTVDGVPAIGLDDGEGTLWVDSRSGMPVRMQTDGVVLRFSDYGQVEAPKAPAADDVLDGKAMGI